MKKKINILPNTFQYQLTEAGCDEAGRGCYAGPVFAAAVILPMDFKEPYLNDSKQLKPAIRQELRKIIEHHAIAYGVAMIGVEEIDQTNILKASQKAMHLAIGQLKIQPEFLAIDGNYFIPYKNIPHQCIIKGDGKYANIAAASILAKTYRDDYMQILHEKYPAYNWFSNKGYGTQAHRDAILMHGLSPHHRKTFNILPAQLPLFSNR